MLMEVAKRILIVEDESDVRAALAAWLEDELFEVAEAKNGIDGLAEFKRFHPDLVILDMHMPGLSGVDLCREIRQVSQIPVMMFTNTANYDDVQAAIAVGATDFLLKRGGFSEVVKRIVEHLNVDTYGISNIDLDEAFPANALTVLDSEPGGALQTFSAESSETPQLTQQKYTVELWTWAGAHFGFRDGDDLWTYDGRHVGKFGEDDEIFRANGAYMGSLLEDRLIVEWQKTARQANPFTPLDHRDGHRRLRSRGAFDWIAGFKDFPELDEV